MAAHITYLSDSALHRRFGRNLQDARPGPFRFDADFQVESTSATRERFSSSGSTPNSYLYMTRAMDYFDLAADYGGSLGQRLQGVADALLRRVVHLRLALSDERLARDRDGR